MEQKKIDPGRKMMKNELMPGCILPAGTASQFETGDWRNIRPEYIEENCIHCLFCWINCPDSAVIIEEGKMKGFDYVHCKGCGICAHECPGKKGQKAIKMVHEK